MVMWWRRSSGFTHVWFFRFCANWIIENMSAGMLNVNMSDSVAASRSKSTAGQRWHFRTAGWPFWARCFTWQVSRSRHLMADRPRGGLRPVHSNSTLRSFILHNVPMSNALIQFMLLADHLIVRQECSVHGSVFELILWTVMSLFCFLAPGKTTSVESDSILRSDPGLFKYGSWTT